VDRVNEVWLLDTTTKTERNKTIEPLLLRPREAARLLGLGRSKVYLLIASGDLPSVRIGRSVRVPYEALRSWVDQNIHTNDSSTEPVHEGIANWPSKGSGWASN
jgi:excisionase family DNA binding protein